MASDRSDLPDERPGDAVLRLRHELLRTTDRAIGAEAEAEALRRTVAALHAQLTEPGAGDLGGGGGARPVADRARPAAKSDQRDVRLHHVAHGAARDPSRRAGAVEHAGRR